MFKKMKKKALNYLINFVPNMKQKSEQGTTVYPP